MKMDQKYMQVTFLNDTPKPEERTSGPVTHDLKVKRALLRPKAGKLILEFDPDVLKERAIKGDRLEFRFQGVARVTKKGRIRANKTSARRMAAAAAAAATGD